MDPTDLAILRELGRDKVLWWGSLDPRAGVATIADRLGLPRSTVRERIRGWERVGFLQGTEALPNPSLFGVSLAGGSVRVADPRAKPRVLADMALVDGLVVALDHAGEWIAIEVLHDTAAGLERRRRLLARLSGVDELLPCIPHRVSRATVEPTPLDWRILRALRQGPGRDLGEVAAEVGISAKTLGRRYARLVEGGAVWSVPLLDFARYAGGTVVRILATLAPAAQPALVAQALRARLPHLLDFDNSYQILPEVSEGQLEFHLAVPNAAAVEDAEREILAVSGIHAVEVLYPRRLHVFGHGLDALLEDRLRATP